MQITLNETLKKTNKSQYKLAQETGIAHSTINKLCNGKTDSIKFETLEKICQNLNCNIEDVIHLN